MPKSVPLEGVRGHTESVCLLGIWLWVGPVPPDTSVFINNSFCPIIHFAPPKVLLVCFKALAPGGIMSV